MAIESTMAIYAAAELSSMDKMWVSFLGIGLMVLAAACITFARLKTRGWIRGILSVVAFVILVYGLVFGLVSII